MYVACLEASSSTSGIIVLNWWIKKPSHRRSSFPFFLIFLLSRRADSTTSNLGCEIWAIWEPWVWFTQTDAAFFRIAPKLVAYALRHFLMSFSVCWLLIFGYVSTCSQLFQWPIHKMAGFLNSGDDLFGNHSAWMLRGTAALSLALRFDRRHRNWWSPCWSSRNVWNHRYGEQSLQHTTHHPPHTVFSRELGNDELGTGNEILTSSRLFISRLRHAGSFFASTQDDFGQCRPW